MKDLKKCPIDNTELSAFNQFELQDGEICHNCAKKIGLIDGDRNSQLAKAAKALITISVATDYINNDKSLNLDELLQAYSAESSTVTLDKLTGQDDAQENTAQVEPVTEQSNESVSPEPTKKEPIFWKGDGLKGFIYGAFIGLAVGLANILFINFGHLGFVVWIAVWLFIGTNPRYHDDSANTGHHHESENKDHDLHQQASQAQQTIIINNHNDSVSKKKHAHGGLVCPHCGSANVQLIATDANIKSVKTKTRVTADINPLHPLTVAKVKHHTKIKKKRSTAKTVTALATAGTSTLFTGGTRSNKSREYHCQECGKTFYKK